MVPFLVPLSRSVLQVTSLNDSSTFLQSLKMLSKEAASGKHKASSPRGVQNLNTEGETQSTCFKKYTTNKVFVLGTNLSCKKKHERKTH